MYGKLEDGTLSDYDYSELSKYVYGTEYSSDTTRKMMYGSKRTLDVIGSDTTTLQPCSYNDPANADVARSDIDEKILELKKEQQKFYDQRNALSKKIREIARYEEINAMIENAIASQNIPSIPNHFADVGKMGDGYDYHCDDSNDGGDNDLLVCVSDVHYGYCADSYWNRYNPDICRNMFESYLDKVIHIAETHRSENCVVALLGDLISGSIHKTIQVANRENVVSQVIGVSELISEFAYGLSSHFKNVKLLSVAGNHSRMESKDDAVMSERLDDIVIWYLRARLKDVNNITFQDDNSYDLEKLDPTMFIADIRGLNYCGVHGDYDDSPAKIQSLQMMIGSCTPLYAVVSGHKHHCKVDNVQGIKTIMSGSFVGMDDYCVQKRIYGEASQMVCVCDEDGVRCSYEVQL